MLESPSPSSSDDLIHRLQQTRRTRWRERLLRGEWLVLALGVSGVLVHVGFVTTSAERVRDLNSLAVLVMCLLSVSRIARSAIAVPGHHSPRLRTAQLLAVPVLWGLGLAAGTLVHEPSPERMSLAVGWTECMIATMAALAVLRAVRSLAARTHNSAVLLAGSFLLLITVGTLLLKMPMCVADGAQGGSQSADWNVALFTATSASCVTGLIVVPTGSHWSPVGHAVIFTLFQIGGLGILTFGAFVAVLSGRRGLHFREARTLRDMLDSESVKDSRMLLLTILLFTLATELVGACCLAGLWSDKTPGQQAWHSVFHSVSAFCNAGFSLQDDGFLNMGGHWQVFGPLTFLIILGGLGFPVIQDLGIAIRNNWRRRTRRTLFLSNTARQRLSVHSRLVLWSALVLLVMGTVNFFFLESLRTEPEESTGRRIADAWFQSVTFRTAGFNTVDHGSLSPATKLMAIVLMFIGAAPGSTGGGVKTVVFAITMLNIYAVWRGRDRVEVFGRCIPAEQVSRALSMIAVGLIIVLLTTGLLVVFEPESTPFLDLLYEATSAFGTVGVSTGVTGSLSVPSQLLIVVVMFLGRVGPITLLLAMAGAGDAHKYSYPTERVSLG
ncbi:MAG: potassium transporter TrkG [Planctomycetaceae bacterium]